MKKYKDAELLHNQIGNGRKRYKTSNDEGLKDNNCMIEEDSKDVYK